MTGYVVMIDMWRVVYCANQGNALQKVTELQATNPAFRDFLKVYNVLLTCLTYETFRNALQIQDADSWIWTVFW